MFPYWALFSVFAMGALVGQRDPDEARYRAGPLLALAAIVAVVLIGLRYRVGADWEPYRIMFLSIGYRDLFSALELTDPGYAFVNWLAHQVGAGIWGVNLACAALTLWALLRFARRLPNPWLTLVVAVPYFLIVVGMGYTRQSVAVAFSMAALAALFETSVLRFLLWMVLASTFHVTAFVLVPLVGLSYARGRIQSALLVLATTAIAYFTVLSPTVDQYLENYARDDLQSQGTAIRVAMNLLPAVLFLLSSRRFPVDPIERKVWRTVSLLSLGLVPAFFAFPSSTAVDRMALYLIPVQLFVLSWLPYCFARTPGGRTQLTIAVIVYSALVQFVWLMFAGHAAYWVPYRAFGL